MSICNADLAPEIFDESANEPPIADPTTSLEDETGDISAVAVLSNN